MGGTVGSDDRYEASAFMVQPQSGTDPWTQPGSEPWQRASAFAAPPGDSGTSSGSSTHDAQSWSQGHVHSNYPAYKAVSGTDGDMGPLQRARPTGPLSHRAGRASLLDVPTRWRKHMHKPVRCVRRFLKRRTKGKGGKGKARGSARFSFVADMTDEEVELAFFGSGCGKGKGKPRSSGKGKDEDATLSARTGR